MVEEKIDKVEIPHVSMVLLGEKSVGKSTQLAQQLLFSRPNDYELESRVERCKNERMEWNQNPKDFMNGKFFTESCNDYLIKNFQYITTREVKDDDELHIDDIYNNVRQNLSFKQKIELIVKMRFETYIERRFADTIDINKVERRCNATIHPKYQLVELQNRHITFLDSSGSDKYFKNSVRAITQADYGLILVSAVPHEFAYSMKPNHGFLKDRIFLAKSMGVERIVIAVNKMDHYLVNYSKERFLEVKKRLKIMLKKIGYNTRYVPIQPVSGQTTENLGTASQNSMKWFPKTSLVDVLNQLPIPKRRRRDLMLPFTMSIFNSYTIRNCGVVVVGKVLTGRIKTGDNLKKLGPLQIKLTNGKSLQSHCQPIEQAEAGDFIGVALEGMRRDYFKKRGHVVINTDPRNYTCGLRTGFVCMIQIITHRRAKKNIKAGYQTGLHAHCIKVGVRFEELVALYSRNILKKLLRRRPEMLKCGMRAVVKMKSDRPVCLTKYQQNNWLSRFALRDSGDTVAVGYVIDYY